MSFDELKTKIISLNKDKNAYAEKKLKGDVNEKDEREMISTLIYMIAELRKIATDIGISEDGKMNEKHPDLEIFLHLNQDIKSLKSQILYLINSHTDILKKDLLKQYKESENKDGSKIEKKRLNTEQSRKQEVVDRLKSKLGKLDEEEN